MLYALFLVSIGVFIGWHLPQPSWVKDLKEKL